MTFTEHENIPRFHFSSKHAIFYVLFSFYFSYHIEFDTEFDIESESSTDISPSRTYFLSMSGAYSSIVLYAQYVLILLIWFCRQKFTYSTNVLNTS